MSKTLYQKVFDAHVVREVEGETPLIYIDRHLVHEVTSPQAFDGLRAMKRPLRRPDLTWATMDHNVSTTTKDIAASGEMARIQMETLADNCKEFGVRLYDLNHKYQGIVHVMGPELGITLPGTTIVCGDSHTATHGAFGSLAFGIGTSEVEHVMATQTLKQGRAKTMRISVNGKLAEGISAKDVVLAIIGKVGAAGGTGYVVEFAGDAITGLGGEHEPHVERVLAAVVVRDLGEGIDRLDHPRPLAFGHGHRGQAERAAHALDLVHRPEAREHAIVEKRLQAGDDLHLGEAEHGADIGEGGLGERKLALQRIDQAAIDVVGRAFRGHTAPTRRLGGRLVGLRHQPDPSRPGNARRSA